MDENKLPAGGDLSSSTSSLYHLPKGWEVKKLGNVCEIELGKTPYRKDRSYWDNEKQTNNTWLSIADLIHTENKKKIFICTRVLETFK